MKNASLLKSMRGIGHSDPHSDPLSDGGLSAGSGVGLSVGLTAANSLWACTRKARADNWSGGRSGELIASLSAAFCLKARGGLCGLVYRSSRWSLVYRWSTALFLNCGVHHLRGLLPHPSSNQQPSTSGSWSGSRNGSLSEGWSGR